MSLEEPSISIEREGNIVRHATVEMSATIDAPYLTAFAYKQEKTLIGTLPDFNSYLSEEQNSVFINLVYEVRPAYTVDEYLSLVFASTIITKEQNEENLLKDTFDFSSHLTEEIIKYFSFLKGKATIAEPFENFVKVKLWCDKQIIETNWNFNFDTFILTIERDAPLLYNYTYEFALYADIGEYATLGFDTAIRPQALNTYENV